MPTNHAFEEARDASRQSAARQHREADRLRAAREARPMLMTDSSLQFTEFAEAVTVHVSQGGDQSIVCLRVETQAPVTVSEVMWAFTWRQTCHHQHDCCGCTFASRVLHVEADNGGEVGSRFIVLVQYSQNV